MSTSTTVDESSVYKRIFRKHPPPVLWHYTSLEGLLGIVSERAIWATDSRYLNDTREYLHAFDLFRKTIASRRSSANDHDQMFLGFAAGLFETVHSLKQNKIFVSSFSESKDQLGQWRAYGASAKGVSVGVDLRKLALTGVEGFLAPCIYSEQAQAKIVDGWLNSFLSLMRTLFQMRLDKQEDIPPFLNKDGTPNPNFVRYVGLEFYKNLLENLIGAGRLCALMKNSSFAEEKEWRLVIPVSRSSKITAPYTYQIRVGPTTFIPYISLSLEVGAMGFQDRIKEIIAGPNPDTERAIDAMSDFLIINGLGKTMLSRSHIPFRTW